jgi:glucosamine--fructose-6-phosphate aminotransferase (isomerizing)
MCGIIAIVRRPATRLAPPFADVLALVDGVAASIATSPDTDLVGVLRVAADRVEEANRLLGGLAGVQCLIAGRAQLPALLAAVTATAEAVRTVETRLETSVALPAGEVELVNAALLRLKDASWAIERDRVRTARAVADLAGPNAGDAALAVYLSIQQALSALDRLEVRGRDSAGLHVLVTGDGIDAAPARHGDVEARSRDPLFRSGSVRRGRQPDGAPFASFVYKAAAEIGELGDNTRALRAAVACDELLRSALAVPTAEAVVLGHTRWASVGIISEANAHPLNGEQVDGGDEPYVIGALNGDVDNFADLIATEGLRIASEITTDAKVIPSLMAANLRGEQRPLEAFRRTVAAFEGSVAIAACTAYAPRRMQLALRGSGQALYVGLAEDAYVVASEPYGVVEDTSLYLRMDGETPGNPDNPNASRGQVIELDGALAGDLGGIARAAYDGTPLPVTAADLTRAQITTRDIDRGDFPHFLLKEITEAPASFRKTLRGHLTEREGELVVNLGPDTLPEELRVRLAARKITDILVIGQGTAAVAGQAVALAIEAELGTDVRMRVQALPATELSGFALRRDMADTLVIAISQSGTTTDTNRTVDLVRSRGAMVVAIVNRRNSDLCDKADGVLYTSDGRDVEMSVASTKAFYAQVAAGFLLAVAIADAVGVAATDREVVLRSLRSLPESMTQVLSQRASIADAARRYAPSRRYWAVVGNGANYIAAKELRIKLSELCYKSIAHDATEDKKHIDLSAEPLILVCAAGLVGSNADDVAKEVAIYRAHKAAPVVIADEGETRFGAALDLITVPSVHPRLAFVLSTVVGHLFGYEAARAIDAQARPLREIRMEIERASAEGAGEAGEALLGRVRPVLERNAARFFDGLRSGAYNGHLEASTAVRLASVLRYALGTLPLEAYQSDLGKIGTPSVVLEDLVAALTLAIEELTRPIDAIKHQAKTVTVGISRADETLLQVPLVEAVLERGTPRDRLSYRTLRTLGALDPAVAEVLGHTRYAVEGFDLDDAARAVVVDRGGISLGIPSRTERDPRLVGTKHRVATDRLVLVSRGYDGRTVILVPEVKDNISTGLSLLHVRLHDRLPASVMRGVLSGYRDRYAELRDAVTETEPSFREDLLGTVDVVDLLVRSVRDLALAWQGDARSR